MRSTGLHLEFSDGRAAVCELDEVNAALSEAGARIWPLDLSKAPDEIRRLLHQPSLGNQEMLRVKDHFLLSRERLLELIAEAGRKPHVPGGGALETSVTSHGYSYPQLYIVQSGIDYSRFDRLHVNAADDGCSIDEIWQMLSGSGVVVRQQLLDGGELRLRLDCPDALQGWLGTYDGAVPHVGSLTRATAGSKLLVQAIGAPAWAIHHLE